MGTHHKALWVVQWVFGIYFIGVGVMHFVVPDGLPELMSWMYELDDNLHLIAGVAEIAGGLGLILPGLTGIRPQLTVLAAVGLMAVMLGAVIWHSGRGETLQIATNVFNIVAMGYVAYGRSRLAPVTGGGTAAAAVPSR
jgi:putative oxidoreductase